MDARAMRIVAVVLLTVVVGACASANPTVDAGTDPGDAVDSFVTDGCTPGEELCNGTDDDCDTKVDEAFPTKGMACTAGMGACEASGVLACDAAGTDLRCDATPGTAGAESCDGVDEDCDSKIDEDFMVGMPCDGADSDTCNEGTIACSSPTTATCGDTSADSVETCNGADDDCDLATDEGFMVGAACDGLDGDACLEGIITCTAAGGTTCSDATGDRVELCNGLDDDCRDGIDNGFALGGGCTVGLGMCARSGSLVCNGAMTGTMCSASAGSPSAETCGNSIDEDCNGADSSCPSNDRAAGATDISAGGVFTVDLVAANDDNWTTSSPGFDCGEQGGRDVFYTFTLPAEEVVYFDTHGSGYDSVVRIFAGSCTALGATQLCGDDSCGTTRSNGIIDLPAGQYCLVVDQFDNLQTVGTTTLTFRRAGRAATVLTGASGTRTGTTTGGVNSSIASCESNTAQPDVALAYASCPTSTVSVNTCTGTAFDTVLSMRTGTTTSADIACNDDASGCGPSGFQSRIANKVVNGAGIQWVIVDGFGTTGNGAFTLSYTIQ